MELFKHFQLTCVFLLSALVCSSVQQANAPPEFFNMPNNNIPVEENTPTTTVVYTVDARDPEGDAITFSMTSAPSTGTIFFGINPTSGEITVDQVIDFETIPSHQYTFTITAADATNSATDDLTIDIINQNEPFTFDQAGYGVSAPEGQPANTYLPDPGFSVTDPDMWDIITCTMFCPAASAGDFTMNTTSCQVYFTGVYSLDEGDPASLECTILAFDTDFVNSATTTLTITVTDANNDTPTFGLPSYIFSMSYYDPVGTTLAAVGVITATDTDAGTYGQIAYSMDQTGLPSNYFMIDSATGELTVQRELPDTCNCAESTLNIPLYATDQGGLQGTSTILINTGPETTTMSTTTTPRNKTFTEEPGNVAWVTVCVVAAVIAVLAAVFILFKFCCSSRREPPLERFVDDDYSYRSQRKTDSALETPRERNAQTWRHM